MEYETDYKKEFDNLHTGSDYDNWLKQYPEEKAGEYRAFIRDSDNKTWYELDFKRDLKETTKIHFEILDSLVIRKRDDLSTPTCDVDGDKYDDMMANMDSVSDSIHKLISYSAEKKDIHYLISAITYIKDNYRFIDPEDKEKCDLDTLKEFDKEFRNTYVEKYGNIDTLLSGPFTVDDIMKKFDSCSERHENDKKFQEQRYKKLDKVRLEDALKNDSIIPIPEEKYQYFLHNWYHWSFVQEYYEDLENQTKLEDMDSHIEEWREISNKLRKWANIFDTLCDKFKDRE